MLTAHVKFQLPLDVLGTGVTASCSPLLPTIRLGEETIVSAGSAAEMCGRERFHELIHERTDM